MPRLRQATQMLRAAATLAELEAPEDPHDLHHVSLSDGSAPPAELPASAQPASSRPWLTSRNSGPARAQSEHLHQPDRARAKERARSLRPHRERAAAFEDDVAKFGVGIFLYFRLIRRLALLFFCLALLSTPIIVMNVLRNPHDDDDGLCATPNAKCFLFTTIGNVASGNSSDLLEMLPGSDAERNLASSLVDAFNTAAFLLFTAWLTRKQGKEVQLADDKAVTASDFTVTVTRIPASVTSAQQVKDFFEREAGGRGVHGAGPQRKPTPRLRVALLEKKTNRDASRTACPPRRPSSSLSRGLPRGGAQAAAVATAPSPPRVSGPSRRWPSSRGSRASCAPSWRRPTAVPSGCARWRAARATRAMACHC